MKKTRKSILLLFLAVCIAISCAFAVAVFAQGGTASEGMTFSADKYFDMQSKVSPEGSITFEAELWVDPTKSEQSMIISNFYSGKSGDGRRTLLLNMQTDGRVRLHTQHASSVTFSTDIRQFCGTVDAPEFVKIAVTADTTNGVTILYVNGVEKERITKDTWNNKGAVFGNTDKVLRIGGDYQSGNTKYFKGILKNIAMYSDVRTAEEISASYSSSTGAYSVDKTDKNLLFAYDLSDSTVTERLVDLSANGNNAINPNVEQSFHGLKIERQEDSVSTNYPSASYEIGKKFDAIPETVEAWVYIPASVGTGRVGIIMGNYTGYALDAHLNFEVHENGVPRIQWYDESGKGQYDIKFSNSKISTGIWTHLALVYDNSAGVASCYLNGELSETKYFYPAMPDSVIDQYYVLGGDTRTLNPIYFKGELGDVSVYSDVRTAEEIKADYLAGVEMTGADLAADADRILYFDIDETDIGKNIFDESNNGYNAFCSTTWLTESEMEEIRKEYTFDPAYSLAIIGDTQYTTRYFPDKLPVLYDWIKKNKTDKNIQYVIGLGDITDANGKGTLTTADKYAFVEDSSKPGGGYYVIAADGEYTEWEVAYHAITILDGVVEYSLIRGNHDMLSEGNGFNEKFASHTAYTKQFIEKGGIYGYTGGELTDVTNAWRTMQIGNVNYLFMGLDYGASDSVLSWASEVLSRDEFKDYRVIISTHGYLYSDGTTLDLGDKHHPTPNSASEIWTKFISRHANVQMVLCGHIYFNNILYNQRNGVNGNTVTEMLIDPQAFDKTLEGLGIVAMFYFSEDGESLAVEYYSTVRDRYFKTVNQISLDLSAKGEDIEEESGWLGTSVAPEGSGSETDPYIVSSAGNLLWMAEKVNAVNTPMFAGKYFKQTADIDLNGFEIYSIGYYFNSESKMSAFAGRYDGNGYVIKNGTVEAYGKSYTFNCEYGYGLFGVIYGAVIENVVLENMQIVGVGVTGGIVGRAASPLVSDKNYESFNIISGCEVKDSVRIVTLAPKAMPSMNFDNNGRGGRIGSICGMAYATVIEGCKSDADITFSGIYGLVGGIVGTVGLNSTVSNCAFTGSLTLYDNKATQTAVFGGIVGIISPTTQWKSTYVGYVHIHDCYNTGNLYFADGITSLTGKTHWGGIVGGAPWLPYVAPTSERPYSYLVENCYNLSEGPERLTCPSMVIGGITGKNCTSANTTSSLYLKNCYSVAVTNFGGDSGAGCCNEYQYQGTTKTKDGKFAVHVIENVATAEAGALKTYTDAIDASIDSIRNKGADPAWTIGTGIPVDAAEAGDKYFDSTSAVYYVYEDNKWSVLGGIGNYLVTEYGVVPGAYVDTKEANPIVLFKNGVFIGAYALFSDGTDLGGAYAQAKLLVDGNADGEIGSQVEMLFLADASATGAFTNVGQILGTVLIDLNGCTLTQNYTNQSLFATVAKNWKGMDSATVNVFDGNIALSTSLLTFDGFGTAYQNADGYKTFYMTFSNVDFSYVENSSSDSFLGIYTDKISGKSVSYELDFTDCTFDLTNNTSLTTVFNAKDENVSGCNCVISITVNGGEIVTSNAAVGLYEENTENGSSVIFAKSSDKKYTSMTVISGTSAPISTANGGDLVFVKASQSEDSVTYRLIEKELVSVDFVPMVSITLDRNLILNVYVPTKNLVGFTFNGVEYDDLEALNQYKRVINGEEYYRMYVELPAAEAARAVKLVASITLGEKTATGTFTFSIPSYAKKVIGISNETEVQLIKDVLSYIRAAYAYFDTVDTEGIAQINEILGEDYDVSNPPELNGSTETPTEGLSDVTFVLEATPAIRFYITGNAEAYSFFVNGKRVDTVIGNDKNGAYVEIEVYAYAMCGTVTYQIDGVESGSYHVNSYYSFITTDESYKNDSELISVVSRFVKYCESAAAYRNYVIGNN